ncbi:MAG: hypothetical protein K9N48_07690 [Verrucomicrobia bacterium]|nr:hypothetical protein [Verrucomicrobiota bacterium]MCF7709109.1 hypothetical protein [Verrucomicrobiota bacterium]
MTTQNNNAGIQSRTWRVRDYNLDATLDSGQAFRWRLQGNAWEGVIDKTWVSLEKNAAGITARAIAEPPQWRGIKNYLALDTDPPAILAEFPKDNLLNKATSSYHGLRILRQPPWECLASFIISSNKQITQIKQIISELCRRFGDPVAVPRGSTPAFAFPAPDKLAALDESELRACKLGFRAPYLLETSRIVASGRLKLNSLRHLELREAENKLLELPGVGPKISACVLLFALGFNNAFPIDTWIYRGLVKYYFDNKKTPRKKLRGFAESYFAPYAGYAQQHLYHYLRMHETF